MKQRLIAFIKNNKFIYSIARRFEKLRFRPIKGRKNKITNKGALFNVKYDIIGNDNEIFIGRGTVVSNTLIFIRGNNHKLTLGEDCKFKEGMLWLEDNGCEISIGNKTTIESAHIAVSEPNSKIIIGADCMFSHEIELRSGDSHSIIDIETNKRINYAQNINIGDHVWIGSRATILKGVTIGTGCIVSTGAIVTTNVPGNSIVAGLPAKVIKTDIKWLRERIYENRD